MLHFFARRLREMEEVRRNERGFTLIELLVVVIIIGILAAVAIPVYLNQRQKAQDASAQSSLRNAAAAQVAYYADNNAWADTLDELRAGGWRSTANVNLTFDPAPDAATEGGYCMQAEHTGSGTDYKISEQGGTVVQGTC